nr:hypothetical protein CFP56_39162 [Quercus suber]
MWRPSGLPPMQPPIKRRPPGRPKKKRALEPDEPRSHKKNRGVDISKQCKACGKFGHNKRSYKREVGGNSSLPRSASEVSKTTRRTTKDGHANSPVVGSAQPSSTDDVTTTAPPPPIDNQSNPRPKRQRKRSAVTTETLHASRNAARYMAAMRFAGRSVTHSFICRSVQNLLPGLSGVHETTKTGFSEQKHQVGPLSLKLPLDDIELDSMRAVVFPTTASSIALQEKSCNRLPQVQSIHLIIYKITIYQNYYK